MSDDEIAAEMAARIEAQLEAYAEQVCDALRGLGVDPDVLIGEDDLLDIIAWDFGAGLSPADAAGEIVDALRVRDADTDAGADAGFWRTLRDCAQT